MELSIAQRLKQLRAQAGITQEELARTANIAYSTVSKIERGAIKDPSFTTVVAFAQALQQPITAFVNEAGRKPAVSPKKSDTFLYCDVNGVLVRFFQRAFVEIAHKTHCSPDLIETAFWHYNAGANKGEMTLKEFNAAMAYRLDLEEFDWEVAYMASVEPVMQMHECLRQTAKTHRIGLLTNIMPGFVDTMIKTGLLPDLAYDSIVDSSVVGAVKPENEIYKIAEEQAAVRGSDILFIDDSRTNLMQAESRGWRVLWFDDYRPEESVSRVKEALL